MSATFNRLKNWIAETLTNEDLNAEIDNILNNLGPSGVGDYSTNAAQMQIQTSPGTLGSESLATSLAGEIERLRFVIQRMIGADVSYWYEAPGTTLSELNTLTASVANRIVSGKSRAGSSQLVALDPDGSAATVYLRGASTSFVYRVNGTQYTVSSDISATSLQTAPSSNNTALVNDTGLTGVDADKLQGENGTTITIDNVGSEITALVGRWAAFKTSTEYFIAYVQSTTTLTHARRGFFFDSSDAPIERVAISDNDTITLMNLTYIYLSTAGTLVASYVDPIVSADEPGTATVGQYWFDLDAQAWKLGNGASFDTANVLLVGYCVQDSSNCVAARTLEIYKEHSQENTCQLEYLDATAIQSVEDYARVSVFGTLVIYGNDNQVWDIDTDLDSGISESSSTIYYAYMDEDGDRILSDIAPYDRTGDLLGYYHPHQTWRCLGYITNNGSSDFDSSTLHNYGQFRGDLIEDETIGTTQLEDSAVTTAKVADGAITSAKLGTALPVNRVKAFTSSGSSDVGSDVTWIAITGIGGGGGGGGGGGTADANGAAGGGGGSGGAFATGIVKQVSGGDTITVTIGSGGGGGTGGTSVTGTGGSNGTATTVTNGTWTVTFRAGIGGGGGVGGTGATKAGGAGGTSNTHQGTFQCTGGIGGENAANSAGAGGDSSLTYSGGGAGSRNGAAGDGGEGGGGGAGLFGAGGDGGAGGINAGSVAPVAGSNAATNSGGGGGGAGGSGSGVSTGATGGNGAAGYVVLGTNSSTDFT